MIDQSGATFTLLVGHAPADDALVDAIQQIDVDTALEEASVLRLRFGVSATETGDWTILDQDPFRPLTSLQLRVQRGAGLPEAVINAAVTQQRVAYAEGGGSTLEVIAMDATYAMNLEEKVTAWPNLSDGAIAAQIFGQHDLIPRVDTTSPTLTEPEGTTIQRGTDIRFLRRLARRNGFDCYVQPEPSTGLDTGHFRKRDTSGAPSAVLSVELGDDTNVEGFSIRYDLVRPTGARASGVDFQTKQAQPAVTPTAAEQPLGSEPTLSRVTGSPTVRPSGTGLSRTSDIQRAAQAAVDRSSWAVVASGTVGLDVPVLRPGALVGVRGAGRLYNGNYVLTRVRHTITAGSFRQQFEAARNAVTETGAEVYVEVA